MKKVKLIKSYNGHAQGEIIEVSNNVAFGLIESGIASSPETKDFLVKPPFSRAETRSFQEAPQARYPNRYPGRARKK